MQRKVPQTTFTRGNGRSGTAHMAEPQGCQQHEARARNRPPRDPSAS